MNTEVNGNSTIMFSMVNFGDWLLEQLRERNLSQSELAKQAGISKGTVSNLVNGTKGAGQDSLIAIARVLRLPPDLLFEKAGLFSAKPELTPKKRELMERLRDAEEADVQMVIEILEAAVRAKQRQVPGNLNPKTTPR